MAAVIASVAALLLQIIGIVSIFVGLTLYFNGRPMNDYMLLFIFAGVALNRADLYELREKVDA